VLTAVVPIQPLNNRMKQLALAHILESCKKNDRMAQKELFERFYSFAISVAVRYTNNTQQAEEVANEGFFKLLTNLHKFITPDVLAVEPVFIGWFKKILVHTAIDYSRKYNKVNYNTVSTETHEVIEIDSTENAIDKMSYNEILNAVNQLPTMYKTVFNLYVIDGLKHNEIANLLGIAEGTSKSNLAKARTKLQENLKYYNHQFYEQRNAL
jgi:RNA polymerase sigma factor (sigma-70 family)